MNKSSKKNVTKKDAESLSAFLDIYDNFINNPNLNSEEFELYQKTNESFSIILNKYFPDTKESQDFRMDQMWKKIRVTKSSLGFEYYAGKRKKIPDTESYKIVTRSKTQKKILNKYFSSILPQKAKNFNDIYDAENIIKKSNKVSYLRASGIIASNFISSELLKKCKREGFKIADYDIKNLVVTLRKTNNKDLRNFININFRRFEDSSVTRNRCAHINRGEPTEQEIEQLIAFAKILKKNL